MKRILVLTMISLFTSTAAYAWGPFATEKMITTAKARMNQKPMMVLRDSECATFTGKWKGTCEGTGNKTTSEFEIEQGGCYSIKATSTDEQGQKQTSHYDLAGGLKTEGGSGLFSIHFNSALAWSADKQVLLLEANLLGNSLFFKTPLNVKISGQLMKDKEDLLIFSHTNGDPNGDKDQSCRYSLVK